jgi:hypothetical protein
MAAATHVTSLGLLWRKTLATWTPLKNGDFEPRVICKSLMDGRSRQGRGTLRESTLITVHGFQFISTEFHVFVFAFS